MPYEELLKKYNEVQAKYEKTKKENSSLKIKVENLQLQINTLNRYLFGPKRENVKKDEIIVNGEQMSIFEERAEEKVEISKEVGKAVEELTVYRKKNNRKSTAGIKRSAWKDIKLVENIYELDEKVKCPVCGGKLKEIGQKVVRKDIEIIPAQIIVNMYIEKKYKCPTCEKENRGVQILGPIDTPKGLLAHSFLSPSLASDVIYEKYFKGVPLYRQEKVWDEKGLVIPRSMMSNWCIKLVEYYLKPIYNLMLKELKEKNKVAHVDETTIQCNKEEGKKASTESYMWVFASGEEEKEKGVVFKYNKSRSEKVAQEFLEGYKGIMITDRICGI